MFSIFNNSYGYIQKTYDTNIHKILDLLITATYGRGIIPYVLFSKYNKKIAFSISIILFSCIHVLVGTITMLVALILGALFLILRFQCNSLIL